MPWEPWRALLTRGLFKSRAAVYLNPAVVVYTRAMSASAGRDGASAKPTLESTVTRYRREVARGGPSPELEIRLQEVDYTIFAAIYAALLAKQDSGGRPVAVGEGVLSQMVGAITDAGRGAGAGAPRPARIREIHFEGGRRLREQLVRKELLMLPFRVPSSAGLAYTVALSSEHPDSQGLSSDEGTVIRVKARVSFEMALTGASELRPELHWRVDMTVVRQMMGADAGSALKPVVAQMFAPAMTPATFLAALRLDDDASPAPRQLYRYEVEAEFMGPDGVRDAVRPADVTAAAEAVLRLANPEYVREAAMQAEVYRAAQYIVKAPGYLRRFAHELGLKRLLPQACAITRADYRKIYPPKGLYLTDKADGRRAVAAGHDGRAVIVADLLLDGFKPLPSAGAALYAGDTILDGELVDAGGELTFYAFDVIVVAGEDVSADGFEKRVGRLAEATAILRALGLPAVAKAYARLSSDRPAALSREIGAVHGAARPYLTDGLIFVEPGKPYLETASYKWKPAEHNTIDVLARRAPASVLGKTPFIDQPGHKLYFLFVGINSDIYAALGLQWCPGYADLFGGAAGRRGRAGGPPEDYFPIQFSPSDAPLAYLYHHPDGSPHGGAAGIDGSIVEVRCAGGCRAAGGAGPAAWEVTRVRDDRRRDLATKRYFGNDFYTAELIWLNYVDPFPLEQLWEGPGLDYFMRPKAGIYLAQTGVISFVKTQRITALKHAGWVVDVGAGKGQDLGRYLDAEVQHLVAVDRDRAALSELVRRKYDFAKRSAAQGGRAKPQPRAATTIHVLAADATDPFGQTLDKFELLGLRRMAADALVCNLAVHYFLADLSSMRNFVALARGAVKVGGQVILTVLVGEAVHAALAAGRVAEGETWDVFEPPAAGAPPARKYSLKRLYASETLEATGQRIGVLLPFSDGQYYEEFLVNTKVLIAEFAARGFSCAVEAGVLNSLPNFEAHNRAQARLLTDGDRRWLALYGELVFQRDK